MARNKAKNNGRRGGGIGRRNYNQQDMDPRDVIEKNRRKALRLLETQWLVHAIKEFLVQNHMAHLTIANIMANELGQSEYEGEKRTSQRPCYGNSDIVVEIPKKKK
eukprot:175028_1